MRFFLISIFVLVTWQTALAGLIRVEKDGSGDFAVIQDAVDAAASGDTIQIGPGRFDTFHPCVAPGWTEDAIVSVTRDSLTFLGSGKGVTILGTEAYYGTPETNPKVFCSIASYYGVIKDMTIENVEQGVYWFEGWLIVENCIFRGFHNDFVGISSLNCGGSATNCEFEFSDASMACLMYGTEQGFSIQNCFFRGWGFGVGAYNGSKNISISGCSFVDNYAGIWFDFLSTGSIINCNFSNISSTGITLIGSSQLTLESVSLNGADVGISVSEGSIVSGSNIVVENTSSAGLVFALAAKAIIHNSHIFPASGWGVHCYLYPGDHQVLDMTQNYWGTTDPDSIAAMISDFHDEPIVHCTVEFEPFADGPVPTEKQSLGGFRSMFR